MNKIEYHWSMIHMIKTHNYCYTLAMRVVDSSQGLQYKLFTRVQTMLLVLFSQGERVGCSQDQCC